jgi:hypothetical protein
MGGSYSFGEKSAYVEYVNHNFTEDEYFKKIIPIKAEGEVFFQLCFDGVIIAKLYHNYREDVIGLIVINIFIFSKDMNKIIVNKSDLNSSNINQNCEVVIETARKLGWDVFLL